MLDMLNPMHRLWSDGRWNKLTVAHGCYWKKCSFCDVSLDYIGRYETASAECWSTASRPSSPRPARPASTLSTKPRRPRCSRPCRGAGAQRRHLLVGQCALREDLHPRAGQLLADSGCIAISGGLEVASDRLLALMKKGVTVDQVARVTKAFSDAGILVHAYLMYGFPTQTVQDTVDALEYVRQLFQRLHPQRLLPPLQLHRALARGPQPRGIRHELLPLPRAALPRTTSASSTPPASTTTPWARR
jgi:hypothetical protein